MTYLFSVLRQLGVRADFSFAAPDFVCPSHNIAIEATIASHAHDDVPEWKKTVDGITHDDLEGAYIQSIIRLSNAFLSKATAYTAKYETLLRAGRGGHDREDHCRDDPSAHSVAKWQLAVIHATIEDSGDAQLANARRCPWDLAYSSHRQSLRY
jgi:hypothetical protein